MSRASLIAKVDRCVKMMGSDSVSEAMSAIGRARDLCSRYEIAPSEVSAEVARALETFSAAAWLTMTGSYTRWAAEVGEGRDFWDVTRLGRVSGAAMIEYAVTRRYRRFWTAAPAERLRA